MAEKETFHCHQAATKGFQAISEDYCLTECDSLQKGLKAQCPESIKPAEAPKVTEGMKELLKQLKELNLPEDEFAIFGSGPLGIRGIREVNDIDLIVLPGLWKKLSQKYSVENKI